MTRKIQWIVAVATTVLCAACDAHIDEPDTAVRPGHILCEDGTALSYAQYELSGKRAIAATTTATTLTYDNNATLKGLNLIGNPYPCNATKPTNRLFSSAMLPSA